VAPTLPPAARRRLAIEIVVIVVGVPLLVGAGCLLLRRGCEGLADVADLGCENRLLDERVAPDGKLKAVVFVRNCGATTSFSTEVSILEAAASLPRNGGEVVFVATTGHGLAPAGPGGGPEVQVRWEGPSRLTVSRHAAAVVFKLVTQSRGVAVDHETFRRPTGATPP
jgi:hypothetical protein